jgi:hypothetical protein
LFNSEAFVALENPKSKEVIIEFLHARYMSPIRFVLQAREQDKYANAHYINALIESYYRNPSKFCNKRRVLSK